MNSKLAIAIHLVIAYSCVLAQTSHPGSITTEGGINPVTLTANGTDTYVGTMAAALKSHQPRACYVFTPDVANTGPASLKIDDLAAKSIIRQDGGALEDADLKAGKNYLLCYNSGSDNLQLIGVAGSTSSGGGSGTPGGSAGQLQFNNGTFAGVTGTSVSGSRITHSGKLDLGSGSFRPPTGTELPTGCEVGDEFFKSNEVAGRNKFGCTSPGVWTLQGDGGGGAGSGCGSGAGVHIPATGGPKCRVSSTTAPFALGGLDFPDPDIAGTTCLNLDSRVPTGHVGLAPDLELKYARTDGTWATGAKVLFSVKTWYPDEGTDLSTASWTDETLVDISPTGSDVLDLNKQFTSTARSLNITGAAAKKPGFIQLCRQKNGAGGRTDTLHATVRVYKSTERWTTGTRVTTTVGTTGAGTSVTVAQAAGAVSSAGQKIIIVGAGAAGANYVGTISTVSGTTFTITPSTSTSVPANTLAIFEASLFDHTFNFTGTGPESSSGSGGSSGGGSELNDDVREWTTTEGTTCRFTGVNTPASGAPSCVVNAGSTPESGAQFVDSASTCVFLRTKMSPKWDTVTAPTLFLTAAQIGAGTGNVLMNASAWHIAEGATYNSPSFTSVNCTATAGAGDLKKFTIECPNLSTTGAGAGRATLIRICRDGANGADTLATPVRIYESAFRSTETSACPAP